MTISEKEAGVQAPTEKLLVLQDRDRKIKQLTREIEDIPARKKLIDSRLNQHREGVKQAQEEFKKKLSASKQIDIDIEGLKAKILKLREQQNNIKTNEEYRAIEREVTNIQKQIAELEDKEIAIMEESEVVKAQVQELESSLKREEATISSEFSVLDGRVGNLQAELDQLKADRDSLVVDIPDAWLSRYERTFKHNGDFALVPVDKNGSCGGCHMKLPPQVVQDVKRNASMVCCSYCGRILYWQR